MLTTAPERSFDIIQELADMVVQIDIHGDILIANRVFCRNFGLDPAEFNNVCPSQPNLITDIIGNSKLLKEIQDKFESFPDSPYKIELRVITIDGSRWQEWLFTINQAKGQQSLIMGVGRDITEQKRQLDQIIQSEKDSRGMLDGTPSIVISLNRQKKILDCNAQLEHQLRYSKIQVIGKHVSSLVHRDSQEIVCTTMNEAVNSRTPMVSECQLIRRDGTVFEVMFSCTILTDEYDHLSRTICTFWDASHLSHFNRQSLQQLTTDREVIRNKDIALKELLSQMDDHKQSVSQDVQANIDRLILPMIHKMEDQLDSPNLNRLVMLKNSLLNITDPLTNHLSSTIKGLSPREVQVCSLLVMGLASKQIAESLNVSVFTINNQRRSIRKKLGIVDQNINMVSYLSDRRFPS